MYAVNIADQLHNEDVLQQRISTFSDDFFGSFKHDCPAEADSSAKRRADD
jgi:hypothetical protein